MTNVPYYAVTQDRGNRPFSINVREVVQFYKRRHKRKPTVVYCNRGNWEKWGEKAKYIDGVRIVPHSKVNRNYYWAAVECIQ